MQTVEDLKPALYDLLQEVASGGNGDKDIVANQQLGVNLSNAVRKEGVNILQIQSLNVESIVPKIIDVLKLVDQLSLSYSPILDSELMLKHLDKRVGTLEVDRKQIELLPEEAEEDPDPLEDACAFLFESKVKWKEMQEIMKARYALHVNGRFGTAKEGADFLDIQPAYYSKVLRANKQQEEVD